MHDLIWNLFLKTGNIETYLLLKELENEQLQASHEQTDDSNHTFSTETKM
ncbi:MAG TPA: YqzL family protein [Pseudogracilibacillus sp.]|nr:YqzL family protein [Pseudogracilibacillus sp.]